MRRNILAALSNPRLGYFAVRIEYESEMERPLSRQHRYSDHGMIP